MNRTSYFNAFFGKFEVGVDLASGLFLMLSPRYFLQLYITGFDEVIGSPAGSFLAQSFGLMTFMSGLLQYAFINFGDQKTRQWGLAGLLCGDLLQITFSAIYFSDFGVWTWLTLFNFVFTPFLAVSRSYFLITGVPARHP